MLLQQHGKKKKKKGKGRLNSLKPDVMLLIIFAELMFGSLDVQLEENANILVYTDAGDS